jgi:uncharacterized protein (UPF0276 family)
MPGSGRLRGGVGLATTYGGNDRNLLERVVPHIDCLELAPDVMTVPDRDAPGRRLDLAALAELSELASETDLVVHGIGLSIGSASGWNEGYLRLLDEVFAHVDVAWHSEHLGFDQVDGHDLPGVLGLPRTDEVLDLVGERIESLHRRYRVPFLIENVAEILPDAGGDYSPAGFLNTLAEQTGCGILLDLYNLECNAHNQGLDIEAFLAELDLAHVWELHVACGVEHRGYWLDVHSRPLRSSTVDLTKRVVAAAPNLRLVTYELLIQAIPLMGYAAIVSQLEELETCLS